MQLIALSNICRIDKTAYKYSVGSHIEFCQKLARRQLPPKMPQGLRLISMVCPSFVPILAKLSQFAVSFAEKPHLCRCVNMDLCRRVVTSQRRLHALTLHRGVESASSRCIMASWHRVCVVLDSASSPSLSTSP